MDLRRALLAELRSAARAVAEGLGEGTSLRAPPRTFATRVAAALRRDLASSG